MSKYSELARALNDSAGHDLTIMDNAADALRELEAERDRLRELLKGCVATMESCGVAWVDPMGYEESPLYREARAALEGK
jgi:hypothetical protein